MAIEGSGSLRETVEAAFDEVIKPDAPAEAPAASTADAPAEAAPVGDRARDPETGRFTEKGKEPAAQAPAKAAEAKGATPPPQAATPAAAAPKIQRPSTWKKDHWDSFDKIALENPQLAAYINQRESEYAKGVSTYKQEWEGAKPLIDAMAPFMPLLQQHQIEPSQWIGNLGRAHQTLALGTPEQKLATFIRLAGEYRVPVEQMFAQGQDGKWYFNQNTLQQAAAQQQQSQQQPDMRKTVQEILAEERATQEIAAMSADKEKYPHFDEVRVTMAGLLQAGLADGPDGAYKAALQHPKHFHLYEAQQQQQRETAERERAEKSRREAEVARRKAVSPRTATPTSVASGGEGKKSLRDTISSAFDERVSGRV